MQASTGRRALTAAAAVASACAVALVQPARAASPAAASAPLDDAGYVAVASNLQARLDALWDERAALYNPGPGSATSMVNADLLLVHAVAAQRRLDPPLRDDARARGIVRFLTGPRIYAERPPTGADPQVIGAGWAAGPGRIERHPVFETEVVDGLVHAYLARDVLGLEPADVARIRRQIHRVATGRDYAWPALRLNQINWYSAMYAADALVNGETAALANGTGRQLERFLGGASDDGRAAGNFGPGMRFHYLPHQAVPVAPNIDSAEYANIVLSFSRFYGLARRNGMRPPAKLALLRQWVRRVLSGYWTHGGYMNWDSGLGFRRWHQRIKMGLAQQALIGVATQPELQPGREWGEWAKWMLDRSLLGYHAVVAREQTLPAPIAFGVHGVATSPSTMYLAAARHEANAIRALEAGLGRNAASAPPALYSFDPDTGRLAVTTPRYNTAIVAVNQGAFPYGGLDLARLYNANQDVAANIGGTGAAAFGLTARAGVQVLRTQYGSRAYAPEGAPLRLVGVDTSATERAYAGPFTDLHVQGWVRRGAMAATTSYRFTPEWIEARWTLRTRGDAQATVTFPSWGAGAHAEATFADGSTAPLGRSPVAGVVAVHISTAASGYRVFLHGAETVELVDVAPQPSQPDPGPSVAVGISRALTARITVDP
jgi:hypothetical protein